MRVLITSYILLLGYSFGYSQNIDFGVKYKFSWELTDYSNQKIKGNASNKTYTFSDSAAFQYKRSSWAFGFTIKKILPKRFVANFDMTFDGYGNSKTFAFKEYQSVPIKTAAYGLGNEFLIAKKFLLKFFPKSRVHFGVGIMTRMLQKDVLTLSKNAPIPISDLKGKLYHDKAYFKGYYKCEAGFSYGPQIDLLFGFNYGMTKRQNFIPKNELYFDLGFRLYMGMSTELEKSKIYNPDDNEN